MSAAPVLVLVAALHVLVLSAQTIAEAAARGIRHANAAYRTYTLLIVDAAQTARLLVQRHLLPHGSLGTPDIL